jgi:anti-anti-sigma regulatory factor
MDDPEVLAEKVLGRFRDEGLPGEPIRSSIVDDLVNEARPAVHSLVFATRTERTVGVPSLPQHECLAMVTLLGRRLASFGVTPTGALRAGHRLLEACHAEGLALPPAFESSLLAVFVEGYVRGREEHAREEGARALVDCQAVVTLAPGVVLVVLAGELDPDVLEGHVDEVGRVLLRGDAKAMVVDLARFTSRDSESIHAIVKLVRNARVLGVAPFLVGLAGEARETVARADEEQIFDARTVPDALSRALALVGLELRHKSGWPSRLRGMFGRE